MNHEDKRGGTLQTENADNEEQYPQDSARRNAGIYLVVTAFCVIFYLIYNQFSHGVHSPYMTFLFVWPFCLGAVPSFLVWKIPTLPRQGRISANLYHSGVAAVTVSSLLRGIFDIAGTASDYQVWLMAAGAGLLIGGVAAWILGK
ncbi:MAG: hypothetical protein LIO92_11005 [Clostridiales bacterium]|nr:hypothetical protein [Clostridiales bacterium]